MRAVWISGVLTAASWLVMAWHLAGLKPSVIALQLAWSPKVFGEIIHFWPPEGLALYRRWLPFDGLVLLGYGAFGWLLAAHTRIFSQLPRISRAAAPFVLPLAAAFDAAENGLHWWLTEMPRFGVPSIYLISTVCSVLKWLSLILFCALVLWAQAVKDERGRA
ncbi:hypothetical protein [Thauera linaloolentis]|uniref:Transmembrane protein n=1 Tax=Thauera linaloolentis (strain DSM 12138 / JCM 21573 / CCUG 41526 / CIP 105981 / IAM 15112 / NBRC 102519 / 47Lol) TaxID=1123367 RepID=N6YWE6_THAL4|nr:hypothetical protein [Thauera linaloolentis]ENO86747.1 hypothetical protein C666_12470 [Thauera linaloolentis 47Lol = DSM 12138]MCM8567060.1 hypothetical protein [Thauera linaloolentis]